MKTLLKTLRALAVSLILLVLGITAALFAAAALAERMLGVERHFGEVTARVYNPVVSPFFSVRADSIVLRSSRFHVGIVQPEARFTGWNALDSVGTFFRVRADSVDVVFHSGGEETPEPLPFPAALRFPLGLTLEWRVLTARFPGAPPIVARSARWSSRGSQALRGSFKASFKGAAQTGVKSGDGKDGNESAGLRASMDARWRGPALHYRLRASRDTTVSLLLSGIREKKNLRAGYDSVAIFLAEPGAWLPEGFAGKGPLPYDLNLKGRADWKSDSIRVSADVRTAAKGILESAVWNMDARLGDGGGVFSLRAAGGSQSLRARGNWSHPGGLLEFRDWPRWQGAFSGEVRGGTWKVGRWNLPLSFTVSSARMDTGLSLVAHMRTRDSSRIEARWNGRHPRRLALSGDVSPTEAWATLWTDDHISYTAARAAAVWEDSKLRSTVRVLDPYAYGAAADSLHTVNEVTSSGYFLRDAQVYRDGETFTGSGRVLWRNPAGRRDVSLRFTAGHPAHGDAQVTMRFPGLLELKADSLRPARFPYEPVRRFAAYDPWVDGRFVWNQYAATGTADLRADFLGAGGILETRLDAAWDRDSLRVRRAGIATGDARVEAGAVLPFNGRKPFEAWDIHNVMGGAWRVRADHLHPGELLALAGVSGSRFDGVVNGALAYSQQNGLAGTLRLDSLAIPALTGKLNVTGVVLQGMGDSLRLDAVAVFRRHALLQDTLQAVFSRLNSENPAFVARVHSAAGLSAHITGEVPGWRELKGRAQAIGDFPLPAEWGKIEDVTLEGDVTVPLDRTFLTGLKFEGRTFGFRHVVSTDTQFFSGTPVYAGGVLNIPDVKVWNSRNSRMEGRFEANIPQSSLHAALAGSRLSLFLPGGERFEAEEAEADLTWSAAQGTKISGEAREGYLGLPSLPYRVETGYEFVRAEVTLPPAHAVGTPPTLALRGRLRDFFFQRKWGWRDATAFFTAFNTGGKTPATGRPSRPWELDVNLEASGTRNRVDTDVLRMTFTGDVHVAGVYPYTLVRGKVSGLQGEVGQARQAYVMRDFEVKWDNVTLEDGTLYVEGEKRLRADCRAETRQTCQIYIHLDGRLEDVGFTYDTDCGGQNAAEAVPPAVLINSMTQGCYVADKAGEEGSYGSAAFAMLEPALNEELSRRVARRSGGFIKSTQVSGLSALIGDSTGLESVALEVESREVYRLGLKGRAGYHPESKLANPMEYRMAAEYRAPMERIAADSVWKARLRDRFTVEAAVETRPEGRDVEEEREVRQRVGLRYRYRFWTLW